MRQRLRRTSPAARARKGAALLLLLGVLAVPMAHDAPSVLAATRHVDASSAACPGSGTEASPYCLIQTAICNATAGDVIMVAPGTYPESLRMRPGVSVIAEGDYANTTIDGGGKPCIGGESDPPNPGVDFCLPITGSTQCSTVVFGSSFTNADRLDGFTIKNGKGIVRTEDGAISGGGIFVLSSPTISNNMITGNALEGLQRFYLGGGVYMNATVSASPVLTRNTIEGNRAVPQSGTYLAMNYGIGGGVYSGIHVHPTISSNVITSNRAGDVSIFLAGGYGGGIATGTHSGEPAIITSNLIAANMASTDGAGLYIGYGLSASPIARVTNNEIRGNEAGRRGGALSVFYANAEIVNNTLVNNTAKNGGGLYVSRGDPGDLVLVSKT
jgi:hypothetical protein